MLARELSPPTPPPTPRAGESRDPLGTGPLLPTSLPFPPLSDDERAGLWCCVHRSLDSVPTTL